MANEENKIYAYKIGYNTLAYRLGIEGDGHHNTFVSNICCFVNKTKYEQGAGRSRVGRLIVPRIPKYVTQNKEILSAPGMSMYFRDGYFYYAFNGENVSGAPDLFGISAAVYDKPTQDDIVVDIDYSGFNA